MRVATYIFGTRLFQFSGITLFWKTVFLVFEEDFERSGQSFFFPFLFLHTKRLILIERLINFNKE